MKTETYSCDQEVKNHGRNVEVSNLSRLLNTSDVANV